MDWHNDPSIPAAVRASLARLCKHLTAAAANDLIAVVLYGGVAREEYEPSTSDVNVLIVLNRADVTTLDKIRPTIQIGLREIGLNPLIMTPRDLERSADLYPIKFMDMKSSHRILSGRDVLANLQIHHDHLRLRCQQEMKNLLLRLRWFYLSRSASTLLVERMLIHAISPFLRDLRVLLVLDGRTPPVQKRDIVDAFRNHPALDVTPLEQILALKFGEAKLDDAALPQLYNRFMACVDQAIGLMDSLAEKP